MKNFKVGFLFTLSLLIFFSSFAGNSPENEKKILFISSYSPLREVGNHVISSFLEEMSRVKNHNTCVEYMDSESYPAFSAWVKWLNSLFEAYSDSPDLVIILGEEIWAAYRDCCPEHWKDIPVVLGGVKKGYIDYKNWENHQVVTVQELPFLGVTFADFKVTGYYLTDYIQENIRLAKLLQPGLTDLAFCYDDRYHHFFLEDYLHSLSDDFKDIKLHSWLGSRLSTSCLWDSIITLKDQAAILSAGWYTDINRYSHAHSMFQDKLLKNPDKIMYGVLDEGLNSPNYIGGYYVSGREIGQDLARLSYTVLTKGFENSPAFGPTPSEPAYHLNYPAFRHFGFAIPSLPGKVVWYDMPQTFREEYKTEIILVISVICIVILAIFLLLIKRWRRELKYRKSNQRLLHLLELMPDMVILYGTDRRIIDIINPDPEALLIFKPTEIIGKTMRELGEMMPEFNESAGMIDDYLGSTLRSGKACYFNYHVKYGGKELFSEVKMVSFCEGKVISFIHDITALVFAEKKAEKYKNFLRSVMDHLPLGIFIKNVSDEFRYIYYNDGVADFYYHHAEMMLGKNDFEINAPDALRHREEDLAVLESNEPISFERELTDKDGDKHWVVVTKTKLSLDDGSCYILAILVDFTHLRKNEMELENIRNELSLALEAGALSAYSYDVENKMFTSLYRETVADQGLSYEAALELSHPEDRGKYQKFMEDLISGRYEKKKEILRFFRNGCYCWYETHAVGIRSTVTGKVIQVVGTENNITEELKKQWALEENKFKTDLVIKSNGIIQWDYDVLTGIFSSPNVESILYPTMAIGEYLSFIHPDDRCIFKDALDEVIAGKVPSVNVQVRISLWEKDYRWIDMHVVVFKRDKNGRVEQLTGLRRDITDWKKIMEELILLRDKAEESNRLKTAFLANMSHEIRTPLNAIVGFSGLIAQAQDPKEIAEYNKVIETNNELLLQLINDILDLSKIEAGQLEFVFSDVCVSDLLIGVEQSNKYRVKEGVALVCNLPGEDCIINTEKNRITQVLSNFLTNACKFTLQGTITLGYEYIDQGLRFYVSDTGKGISKENLPNVFDRFTKFDAFVQGTGLGLSICQTIINRLGGEIGVESEEGHGSTFWFTLPCKVVKRENVQAM